MRTLLAWFHKPAGVIPTLILGLLFFLIFHLILPLELMNSIADNFNKVAIGITALVTAYFGSSYVREEISRSRSIKYYKTKYPPEKFGTKYKIVASEEDPGALFLLDLESLHKHHIWNMKTMYDLGWQTYKVERFPKNTFLSYLIGDFIRTRGDLGE